MAKVEFDSILDRPDIFSIRKEAESNPFENAVNYADSCMHAAIRKIDAAFGEGYAKANPGLVGKFMEVCNAVDTTGTSQGLERIADAIGSIDTSEIAKAIYSIAEVINVNTPLKIELESDR
jgi:hypothetical protein